MTDIVKILHQGMKRLFNKKGQGLVEFALILAFCVGIGLAARDAGLLNAMGDSLNNGVFAFLNADVDERISSGNGNNNSGNSGNSDSGNSGNGNSGNSDSGSSDSGNSGNSGNGNSGNSNSGSSDSGDGGNTGGNTGGGSGWGWDDDRRDVNNAAPITYYDDEASRADRLAADQEALINIAKHFMGKTQKEVQDLLKGNTADMGQKDKEVLLGHLVPDAQGGMMFKADGALNKAEAQNIFAWMQGIQDTDSDGTKDSKTGAVINEHYDPSHMYLVSDYAVSQDWVKEAGIEAGTYQRNGLRMRLEYDYSNHTDSSDDFSSDQVRVIGVQLSIDPRSQSNTVLGQSEKYNSQHSLGLDVQVRLDGKDANGEDKYRITRNNTGVPVNSSASVSGDGMYNWYGEGDYRLVKAYIANQAEIINNEQSETKAFTKGQIIYVPGKNSYYIACKDGTQSISNTNVPEYAPNNKNVLVKFQTDDYRYWHENDKTDFNNNTHSYGPKYIKARGTVLIMDNGDIYVYVGDRTSNSNNIPFQGIDDDWIQIRG